MRLLLSFMSLKIKEFVSLAEFTTIKIGGKARFFIEAESEAEIIEALDFAAQNALKIFILGGGSNVLIADEGFDGLVLKVSIKGITLTYKDDETVFVTAGAGEDWDELVAFCVRENLQGFECLSGIPGLVGGTPVQNVGAYGQEVSETIVSVRCFGRNTREIAELNNAECGFAYRTSIFNTTAKNRFIVLAVTFVLTSGSEPKIVYKDLREYFGEKKPTLQETRDAVLEIRRAKSMVIDPDDPNSKSAGSFFKNPIVDKIKLSEIEARARSADFMSKSESIPRFVVDENSVKIPAAWLIERSGLGKGFRCGRVGLSSNHSLAIVNFGGAAAQDVLNFVHRIQVGVKEKFDVNLKPEPIFVGFEESISLMNDK